MHGIPQQGVSIHIVELGVPSRNLRCGDPIGQLLPGSEPPDGPVVTTQFGGHFQTVVQKYRPVACCGGMKPEEVHSSDRTLPLRDSEGLAHKLSWRLWSPAFEHSPRNSGPQNQGGPGVGTPHLRVPQSYNEDQDNLIQLGSTPPLDKAWHSGAGFSGETRDDD